MNSTHSPHGDNPFPALRRSFRRADRAKAVTGAIRRAAELDAAAQALEPVLSRPHGPLESATSTWRTYRAREYRAKAAEARHTAKALADIRHRLSGFQGSEDIDAEAAAEERQARGRARWYEGRASAQVARFSTIRGCGERTLKVDCLACHDVLATDVPCCCGVVRVCGDCAEERAEKRQKRIALARSAALFEADRVGLLEHRRVGGAVGEKMLTLTVPHFELDDAPRTVRGKHGPKPSPLREQCSTYGLTTTVAARLAALRLAWPRFMRSLRTWLKRCDRVEAKRLAYYRLLEWTRGDDGKGHPHFHVYMLSRFLPIEWLREWWAEALEKVGCPLPRSCAKCTAPDPSDCPFGGGAAHVIVDIRALYGPRIAQVRELVKSGNRSAIEFHLGELRSREAPGLEAVRYAMGWSMGDAFADFEGGDDVTAKRDLYCALEGRRMAQGARGFLLPLARPICRWCGCDHDHARFAAHVVDLFPAPLLVLDDGGAHLRGPPS